MTDYPSLVEGEGHGILLYISSLQAMLSFPLTVLTPSSVFCRLRLSHISNVEEPIIYYDFFYIILSLLRKYIICMYSML